MRLVAARTVLVAGIVAVVAAIGSFTQAEAHQMSGAIFTTLPDGSVVNENVGYSDKCQVSLNGGPRGSQNDHLPDGDYVIAVTNPNGQTVLGSPSRVVTIGNGEGTFGPTSLCDLVEPSPYDTTPSPGGVYKAWLCQEGRLFVRHDCKTDNFKVRGFEGPSHIQILFTINPPYSLTFLRSISYDSVKGNYDKG